MKKCIVAMLMVCTLVLGFAAVAVNAGTGDEVKASCSSCHDLKRVCRMVGVKDKAAWKKSIDRMVKNGAAVSDSGAMADYLAGLKKGTGPCQ